MSGMENSPIQYVVLRCGILFFIVPLLPFLLSLSQLLVIKSSSGNGKEERTEDK